MAENKIERDDNEIGNEVNRLKGNPNSQHGDFYMSRRESEVNPEDHGSPENVEENVAVPGPEFEQFEQKEGPARKVSAEVGGARRGSYFKDRDYE